LSKNNIQGVSEKLFNADVCSPHIHVNDAHGLEKLELAVLTNVESVQALLDISKIRLVSHACDINHTVSRSSLQLACLCIGHLYMFLTWRYSQSNLNITTLCLKKTGPLRIIWHNFTNSQRLLIIFGRERPYSILSWYDKKFLNWFRTGCVVAIATVVTWRTRTANFWADFEQRVIDRTINEWDNNCGRWACVKAKRTALQTLVVTFDIAHCSDRNTV